MNEDIFTEEKIKEIIQWAETYNIPSESFRLSAWEVIEDPKKYVSTDINTVKHYCKEKIHLAKPAIIRLNRLREYLERK